MVQLVFLLGISWLVLWYFDKSNLRVLGFKPSKPQLKYVFIGCLIAMVFSVSTFAFKMYYTGEVYGIVSPFLLQSVLVAFWNEFRSVLTEELIFRGALFYLLFKKWGAKPAIIITSLSFAAIHLLTITAWNNPVQISMLMVFTLLMGFVLAFAFIRSGTILLPFAIHFGWNLIQNFAFGENGNSESLFELKNTAPEVTISYAAFFTMLLLPKIGAILCSYLLIKRYPRVD